MEGNRPAKDLEITKENTIMSYLGFLSTSLTRLYIEELEMQEHE